MLHLQCRLIFRSKQSPLNKNTGPVLYLLALVMMPLLPLGMLTMNRMSIQSGTMWHRTYRVIICFLNSIQARLSSLLCAVLSSIWTSHHNLQSPISNNIEINYINKMVFQLQVAMVTND